MNEIRKERILFVDFAKFLAIMAVMVDHTKKIIYNNENITYLSYYSVSLFILLMGLTTYWSLSKTNNIKSNIYKSLKKIFIPYIIASFIYHVGVNKAFDLKIYLNCLINFNASMPLYYVILYIQLLIISPIVYKVFNISKDGRKSLLIEIIGLVITIMISFATTNYTNILSIYGGGGKLFGGTYLILLYLGMCFAKYYNKIKLKKTQTFIMFVISSVLLISWCCFILYDKLKIDKYLPFGDGCNPPGLSLILYALLIMLTLFLFDKVINNFDNIVLFIYKKITILGRHTLYIFLYHPLFLAVLGKLSISNIYFKIIIYFSTMIIGSIIIEHIMKKLKVLFKEIYES